MDAALRAKQILSNESEIVAANTIIAKQNPPRESFYAQNIDLSSAVTAEDAKLLQGGAFRNLYVTQHTSDSAFAWLVVNGSAKDKTNIMSFPLWKGCKIEAKDDQFFTDARIYFSAQASKTMTILTSARAKWDGAWQTVDVESGTIDVVSSVTNVSKITALGDGTTFTIGKTTLAAATAAIIAPASSTLVVLQNRTGADLYVGTAASIADNSSIKYPDGAIWEHRSMQALYGYSVAGGDVTKQVHV